MASATATAIAEHRHSQVHQLGPQLEDACEGCVAPGVFFYIFVDC
jgi:hypothetical protein